MRSRGYDFATWSLLDCGMTEESGKYFVKGDPLRFIHFSGYGSVIETCMSNWLPNGEHPFRDLYTSYSEHHDNNNSDGISKSVWSYSVYESGEKINDALRLKYREKYYEVVIENPFKKSNREISSSLKLCKSPSVWELRLKKAIIILRNEGFKALIKKCVSKIKK